MNINNGSFGWRCNVICYLVLFLSFFSAPVFSAVKLDSLHAVLLEFPHLNDTIKVDVLYQLGTIYLKTDLQDSTLFYAEQGLAIANRIKYQKGIEGCTHLMGTVYLYRNEYEKALKYFNDELILTAKLHDRKSEAAIYHNLGNLYFGMLNYPESIENFKKSIALCEQINDSDGMALSYVNLGTVFSDMNNYAEALNYYLKALRIQEKTNDLAGMASTFSNIGNLYLLLGNEAKSMEYSVKGMELFKKMGSKQGVVSCMVNIAEIYSNSKNYNKVVELLTEARKIADSVGDHYWITNVSNNLAEAYYAVGKYDSALAIYKKGKSDGEQYKDAVGIAMANSGIGRIFIAQGNVKGGIECLLQSLKIVKELKMYGPELETTNQLSDAYEKIKDYHNALIYQKMSFDINDSISQQKNDRRLQQLQFDYQLDKKQTQIELLKKNDLIERSQNAKQKVTIIAMLSGLFMLFVIIIILYRSRQQEKRNKEKIYKQKEEIQLQATRLEELNRFKDKTFSVLSHDLRGPLATFTATLQLLDEQLITPEEFSELKPEVEQQLNSLNILLDNLLKWSKSYIMGETILKAERFSLYPIVSENISIVHTVLERKHISILNQVPESTTVSGDAGQIDIVLRNLINNAIKFTSSQGQVTVAAVNKGNVVEITVADTGVGMTEEQIRNLFTPIAGGNTYGTDGEKGIGLGLLLCYEFIKANNGTITVASKVGEGSTFKVTLPG